MGSSNSVLESSKGSADILNKSLASSSSHGISNAVKGVIGEDKAGCDEVLRNLKGSHLKVDSIGIYGTAMEGASPMTHNFLIIEVGHTARGTKEDKHVGYIRAEKGLAMVTYEEAGKEKQELRGKITLTLSGEVRSEELRDKITMEGCGKIPGEKLLEILEKNHNSSYSLLRNNCWKYADDIYRRLIEEFAKLRDTNVKDTNRLRKYLADLPAYLSPADAFTWSPRVFAECLGLTFRDPSFIPNVIVYQKFLAFLKNVILPAWGFPPGQIIPFGLGNVPLVVASPRALLLYHVGELFKAMEPGLPNDVSWTKEAIFSYLWKPFLVWKSKPKVL